MESTPCFRSVPFQFRYELPSTRTVYDRSDSFTVYVPKKPIAPWTVALSSAGLVCKGLLEVYLAKSDRTMMLEYRPLASKLSWPFGLAPHNGLPSASLAVDEMKAHVPTSWSLSDFC